MNVLTAPLVNVARDLSSWASPRSLAERNGGSIVGGFFTFGTLISIGIIGFGIYFIVQGVSGQVEVETDIGTLKTNVVGVALVVIGAALYLGIGKILIGKGKD